MEHPSYIFAPILIIDDLLIELPENEEIVKDDYKIDKDMVLKLTNAEICISSQWASDQMEPFIKRMKSKGIKTS